jgi:hypothetical protein
VTGQQSPPLRTATLRLMVIPSAIYAVWVLELFLLGGSVNIFGRFDPFGIFLYTIIACIVTGLIAALLCIRAAFLSGAVTMFQIGFRSARRSFITGILTCGSISGAVILFNPFGTDRGAFVNAFVLLLPTAIASVMMCWVLLGTHVQAFVRSGGAIISVSVGIAVTGVLYALTTFAYFPPVMKQDVFISSVFLGFFVAFFFFAVRDVYAASLAAAAGSVFSMADYINPLYLQNAVQFVWISTGLAVCMVLVTHWYLSRNFVTIQIPVNNKK